MTDDFNSTNGFPNVLMNGSSICGDQSNNNNNSTNNNISSNGISATGSGQMQPAMSNDKGGESLDGVCRDYMRNVCRRGNNCKFRHPDNFEAEELGKQIEYVFCHDYQNRECRRVNCRFVHATKAEEEHYRSTGKLPPHVLNERNGPAVRPDPFQQVGHDSQIPVCKDFVMGECRRPPGRCKFRHVKPEQDLVGLGPGSGLHQNLQPANPHAPFPGHPHHAASTPVYHHPHQGLPHGMNGNGYNPFTNPHPGAALYAAPHPPAAQTAAFRNPATAFAHLSPNARSAFEGYPDPKRARFDSGTTPAEDMYSGANTAAAAGSRFLEEENSALRRRIDELKKQVADLMATNEFLLEQNASLRSAGAVTVGFTGGNNVPSSAAASVAAASNAAQQAVASAVAAAAAANAAGATCSNSMPPTSVTLELPVSSLAPLAPVFSAAAGLPVSAVSSIAAALCSTQSAPVISAPASTTYVSYPVMTSVVGMGRAASLNHQMQR